MRLYALRALFARKFFKNDANLLYLHVVNHLSQFSQQDFSEILNAVQKIGPKTILNGAARHPIQEMMCPVSRNYEAYWRPLQLFLAIALRKRFFFA